MKSELQIQRWVTSSLTDLEESKSTTIQPDRAERGGQTGGQQNDKVTVLLTGMDANLLMAKS